MLSRAAELFADRFDPLAEPNVTGDDSNAPPSDTFTEDGGCGATFAAVVVAVAFRTDAANSGRCFVAMFDDAPAEAMCEALSAATRCSPLATRVHTLISDIARACRSCAVTRGGPVVIIRPAYEPPFTIVPAQRRADGAAPRGGGDLPPLEHRYVPTTRERR